MWGYVTNLSLGKCMTYSSPKKYACDYLFLLICGGANYHITKTTIFSLIFAGNDEILSQTKFCHSLIVLVSEGANYHFAKTVYFSQLLVKNEDFSSKYHFTKTMTFSLIFSRKL